MSARSPAGRYGWICWTRSEARAAASAGSRNRNHAGLTRTVSAVIPATSARMREIRTEVADQPGSVRRRSRATFRKRCRRTVSPSQRRSAAARASLSPGGTSRPGRLPSAPRPRASGTPPTVVATTGSPRASASVTTMPYVSARVASTSASAVAYATSRSAPVRGPAKRTRPLIPPSRAWRPRRSTKPGSRVRVPTQTQRQDRSVSVARAASNTSCPLPGVTAATQSSSPPAAVPAARSAASTPGSATWTRAGDNVYRSSSQRRVHMLVVTTATAADRTARS